ncbi:MAG: glycosyltransferase [Anaerolineales bacterium]|nr:glycosyltransferase [Anaerolineales bacterium]
MRIAVLSYHTCPLATLGGKETGGMNVYVRDLSRELGRRGIGLDVFTRSQDEHQPHVKEDLGSGNRVIHIPAGPEVPLPKEILYEHIPEFVGGIREFARAQHAVYDLIHSHYWLSGVAARSLHTAWNVPFVQMFHTLGHMKNRVAQDPTDREGSLRLRVETELLREADRIIAATPAELAQLQWLYRADVSKVTVIPPGVDLDHFYPRSAVQAKQQLGLDPGHKLLLFVGRIEPLKGIETLFEAVARLRDRGACECGRLYVVIIGGDPSETPTQQNAEMERLKAVRQRLGIAGLVTFIGAQDQDALPDYYAAADAVIMPSHYESFGMVALEAMACGTPVIASEVGGLAYLVRDGETGFHVPDRDPEILSERICDILTDPQLRQALGEQAARHARAYAWPLIADRILEVYQAVLAGRTPVAVA